MKPPRATIIGIGQDAAGNDGAGLATARYLRAMALPEGVEVIEQAEPSALLDYLTGPSARVIVIDALLGAGRAGRVVEIDPSQIASARLVSTHGIGLAEAIAMGQELGPPERKAARLSILAITIGRRAGRGIGLSPAVAAAIPIAAARAIAIASDES